MRSVFKSNRGSEIIQTLVVIALMGAVTITSILPLSNGIGDKTLKVNNILDAELDVATE